ncbi:MAG: nucleotide sugar dehydrogenase, partial [Alphaproteobacteria bacterium]|nr:nucleotide sugar dehydrogenase [Alphaproteobacteria bacterium]
MAEKIAVIGLGYVGLPVLIALAERFSGTIGFDIDTRRIEALRQGTDATKEVDSEKLARTTARLTADPVELTGSSFFIVTVPTPIDADRRPDLRPLESACQTIGRFLRPDAVVVFESTVY